MKLLYGAFAIICASSAICIGSEKPKIFAMSLSGAQIGSIERINVQQAQQLLSASREERPVRTEDAWFNLRTLEQFKEFMKAYPNAQGANLRILLEMVSEPSRNGKTLIHLLIEECDNPTPGQVGLFQMLLKLGANLDHSVGDKTPRMLLDAPGKEAFKEVLVNEFGGGPHVESKSETSSNVELQGKASREERPVRMEDVWFNIRTLEQLKEFIDTLIGIEYPESLRESLLTEGVAQLLPTTDNKGKTLIHLLIEECDNPTPEQIGLFKFLLELGANLDHSPGDKTPRMLLDAPGKEAFKGAFTQFKDDKKVLCSNKGCQQTPTKTCSRCKKASYCSQECQKKDWPDHKHVCHKGKRAVSTKNPKPSHFTNDPPYHF